MCEIMVLVLATLSLSPLPVDAHAQDATVEVPARFIFKGHVGGAGFEGSISAGSSWFELSLDNQNEIRVSSNGFPGFYEASKPFAGERVIAVEGTILGSGPITSVSPTGAATVVGWHHTIQANSEAKVYPAAAFALDIPPGCVLVEAQVLDGKFKLDKDRQSSVALQVGKNPLVIDMSGVRRIPPLHGRIQVLGKLRMLEGDTLCIQAETIETVHP